MRVGGKGRHNRAKPAPVHQQWEPSSVTLLGSASGIVRTVACQADVQHDYPPGASPRDQESPLDGAEGERQVGQHRARVRAGIGVHPARDVERRHYGPRFARPGDPRDGAPDRLARLAPGTGSEESIYDQRGHGRDIDIAVLLFREAAHANQRVGLRERALGARIVRAWLADRYYLYADTGRSQRSRHHPPVTAVVAGAGVYHDGTGPRAWRLPTQQLRDLPRRGGAGALHQRARWDARGDRARVEPRGLGTRCDTDSGRPRRSVYEMRHIRRAPPLPSNVSAWPRMEIAACAMRDGALPAIPAIPASLSNLLNIGALSGGAKAYQCASDSPRQEIVRNAGDLLGVPPRPGKCLEIPFDGDALRILVHRHFQSEPFRVCKSEGPQVGTPEYFPASSPLLPHASRPDDELFRTSRRGDQSNGLRHLTPGAHSPIEAGQELTHELPGGHSPHLKRPTSVRDRHPPRFIAPGGYQLESADVLLQQLPGMSIRRIDARDHAVVEVRLEPIPGEEYRGERHGSDSRRQRQQHGTGRDKCDAAGEYRGPRHQQRQPATAS